MGTRVSYPIEMKMKAIEMKLAGVPVKQVLIELNILHKTQAEIWMRWYKKMQNSILVNNTHKTNDQKMLF